LGASSVASYDCSAFEGATYVADFNKPLDSGREYDTVLDFGSIEHIYDVSQAFENLISLCRPGGQVLHVSPGNNWCGHGFWQLSPELFFSLYSPENGFRDTEVFLAKGGAFKYWFKVTAPVDGQRAMVSSSSPFFVICRTVKDRTVKSLDVQQSDYVHLWAGKTVQYPGFLGRIKELVRKSPLAARFTVPIYHRFIATLSIRNPHLTKVLVRDLLQSSPWL
jgi:hypothetical protein